MINDTIKNRNSIRYTKQHPVVAGFIDYYFLGVSLGLIPVFIQRILNRPIFSGYAVTIFGLLFNIVIIIAVILYYKIYSKKNLFLSFGERVTGRIIEDGEKKWASPYKSNRLGIFFIIFITIFLVQNIWDASFGGMIFSFAQIISKGTQVFAMFLAIYIIGKGNINGILIPTFFNIILLISALINKSPVVSFYLKFCGLNIITYVIVYIYYFINEKKHKLTIKENEETKEL